MNDSILVKHMEDDAAFQDETRAIRKQDAEFKQVTERSLSEIHGKIDGLATKEDIQDLKNFMKNIQMTIGFFRITWNNIGTVGSLISLVVAIMLLFKFGLVGLVAWVTGTTTPQ